MRDDFSLQLLADRATLYCKNRAVQCIEFPENLYDISYCIAGYFQRAFIFKYFKEIFFCEN